MKRLIFSIFLIFSITWISSSKAADIQGTFYLVPQKSDNVAQIEDSVLSGMNLFIRPFARDKISKAARVRDRLSIALSGHRISIVAGDYKLPIVPTDGTLVMYHNREGHPVGLRTSVLGNKVKQTFLTDNGSRTDYCELSNDGKTLKMHVIIRSDYFVKPMVYTLVYRKGSRFPAAR